MHAAARHRVADAMQLIAAATDRLVELGLARNQPLVVGNALVGRRLAQIANSQAAPFCFTKGAATMIEFSCLMSAPSSAVFLT